MATEYAAPFAASTIATSQQYRDRYRPGQWDYVDDNINGAGLAVTNAANVNVNIANGSAVVQAALYQLTAGPAVLAVAANGGGSNRFDIVVLRYDSSHSPGVYLATVQGTPGSGMPALTRSSTGIWEMPLAHYEKQPGGNLVNLVDRRIYSDGVGGIIGPDVNWAPVGPGRRTGMRFRDWTTKLTYTYDGSSWVADSTYGPGWTPFTTTWTGSTSNPVKGNAVENSAYKQDGKTVSFRIHLIMGSTTTYGSGAYSFSLPVAPSASYAQSCSLLVSDVSVPARYAMTGLITGTSGVFRIGHGTASAGFAATVPFTLTTSDEIAISGTYETP